MSSYGYCFDFSNKFRNCICDYAERHEYDWDQNLDQLCNDGWVAWQESEDGYEGDRLFAEFKERP